MVIGYRMHHSDVFSDSRGADFHTNLLHPFASLQKDGGLFSVTLAMDWAPAGQPFIQSELRNH